jgi:ATP-dependent Lon protease
VPAKVRDEMTVHLTDSVRDVLKHALEETPTWPEVERMALSS